MGRREYGRFPALCVAVLDSATSLLPCLLLALLTHQRSNPRTAGFGDWAQAMERDGRAAKSSLAALYASMFVQPGSSRFCFTAGRDELPRVTHPLLIFAGKDLFHPTAVAKEIAHLAPNADYVERWRDEDYTPDVDARIESFLQKHAAGAYGAGARGAGSLAR